MFDDAELNRLIVAKPGFFRVVSCRASNIEQLAKERRDLLAERDIAKLIEATAPVGSELKDDYQQAEEPDIDTTGFEIAPVGSELSTAKKEPDPPPPDEYTPPAPPPPASSSPAAPPPPDEY